MRRKTKKILIIILSIMLVGLLIASASLFGKGDWNTIKNKVSNIIQKEEVVVDSKNALQNSNFSKNSREVSVFDKDNSQMGHALVDNWIIIADPVGNEGHENVEFTSYQISDGLYFKNTGDVNLILQQNIDEGVVKYANKVMTLSVCIDGVVYSGTGTLSGYYSIIVSANSNVNVTASVLISSNQCFASIRLKATTNCTINWVQLEEGPVFTGYSK